MTNAVDISQETIDSEWEALASGAGLDFAEDGPEPVPGEPAADGEQLPAVAGPSDAESLAMATVIIRGGLELALSMISGVALPGDKLDRTAEAWAAVICKYYKGGVFEFLERFKEEIAALGATLALAGALAAAKREKREAAALAQKKDKGPAPEATSRRVDRGEGGE